MLACRPDEAGRRLLAGLPSWKVLPYAGRMSIRHITASLAALALSAAGFVLAAPPATAAGTHNVYVCHESSVRGNPGDSILLHNDCGKTIYFWPSWTAGVIAEDFGTGSASTQILDGASRTLTMGTVGSGAINFQLYSPAATVTISVIVVDPAVEVVVPRVIVLHDEFQQVGLPASGSCADVPSPVGHYPGFPFGGWSQSWAQWINGGAGGPVCTRELYFDQSAGEWEILR